MPTKHMLLFSFFFCCIDKFCFEENAEPFAKLMLLSPNPDPNPYPNSNPNPYPNSNPNSYPNSNPNSNPNPYPNSNPNPNPNHNPNPNSNPKLGMFFHKMCELYLFSITKIHQYLCCCICAAVFAAHIEKFMNREKKMLGRK